MSVANPAIDDLESLGQSLCRSITAGDYEQARLLADRCVALDTSDTHEALLALLERARRLAIAQRSLTSARLADLESAGRYTPVDAEKRYLASG